MPTPRQIRPTVIATRHRSPLVGAASSRPDRVLIRAGVQWFRPAWGRASCARTAPPGPPGLRTTPPRSWRHVGMPPYSVRRGYGENRGPARAAASRPYGPCSTIMRQEHTSSLFPFTYSLTQKNPTCKNASRIFLCWRYLSSRAVTRKVLSAKVSLTSVFEMGTGGPSPQSTPTASRLFFLDQDVP